MVLPRFLNNLPIFNFFVATSALTFQVCILYPWHHHLSDQIHTLQKELKDLKEHEKTERLAKERAVKEVSKSVGRWW